MKILKTIFSWHKHNRTKNVGYACNLESYKTKTIINKTEIILGLSITNEYNIANLQNKEKK